MATITVNDFCKKAFNYFVSECGMTKEGSAGLCGNIYAESAGFFANRVEFLCIQRLKENGKGTWTDETYTKAVDSKQISKEEFLHPLTGKQYGYGACQWTSPSRKQKLYEMTVEKGVSIADEEKQLAYIKYELEHIYTGVYKVLKSAKTVKEASDKVLKDFESPNNWQSLSAARIDYGNQIYAFMGKITASESKSEKGDKVESKKKVTEAEAIAYTKQLLKHYPFVYCPTLAGMTSNTTPHKGDVVLFYRNGTFAHTGYVYNVEGSTYYTIEGNTSGASGVIANGGGVCKKSYSTSSYKGTRFFRPDYGILVKDGVFKSTGEAINAVIETAQEELGYLEKKSNSQLESKTANAGSNNYTKYWADVYPSYQAQPWCACFVTWVFKHTIMSSNGKVTVSGEKNSTVSGEQGGLNESPIWKGRVKDTSLLNVRKYAGTEYDTCSFSPLKRNTEVEVCDTVKARDGKEWYFIRYDGKLGFVAARYIGMVSSSYMVKVTVDTLNIRSGSGMEYGISGTITDRGVYTIVEEKNGFGKLKSGAGWISLAYTQRI